MSTPNILDEYTQNKKVYDNFKQKTELLLKELLQDNVNYHHITSRVKEKDSLKKKISTKENKYSEISEITDIVGCRIITYFEDDVEKVVDIIEKEFKVDEKNSVNKKEIIESDKFGYLSYHIVCSINHSRQKLPEYKNYKNLKFEIQVRSILQHAWAEIEHDIGYKSISGVPKAIRRKFSRIAGLLETADEGFCDIKEELKEYNESIKVENTLLKTDLNLDSLYQFTLSNKIIKELDNYIAKITDRSLDIDVHKPYLSDIVLKLNYFNIDSIQKLDKLIKDNKENVKKFANAFFTAHYYQSNDAPWWRGISYFYLAYLQVAKTKDLLKIQHYLNNNNIKSEEKNFNKIILDSYLNMNQKK